MTPSEISPDMLKTLNELLVDLYGPITLHGGVGYYAGDMGTHTVVLSDDYPGRGLAFHSPDGWRLHAIARNLVHGGPVMLWVPAQTGPDVGDYDLSSYALPAAEGAVVWNELVRPAFEAYLRNRWHLVSDAERPRLPWEG
jgi:hypothetical protein